MRHRPPRRSGFQPRPPATSPIARRSGFQPRSPKRRGRVFRLALLPATTLFLTACASTHTLRADAERAFREHNRVASEVMLILPDLDPETPEARAIIAADAAMLEACERLNAVAVARRDGTEIGMRERLRIPTAIEDCEAATAAVAELLRRQGG